MTPSTPPNSYQCSKHCKYKQKNIHQLHTDKKIRIYTHLQHRYHQDFFSIRKCRSHDVSSPVLIMHAAIYNSQLFYFFFNFWPSQHILGTESRNMYVQIHKLRILAVFNTTWPELRHFYLIGNSIREVPVRVAREPRVPFLPTQWLKAGMRYLSRVYSLVQ